jgi:hypothetical protein
MRFEIQFELRFSLPQLRFHARGGLPQQSFSVDALLQESRKRRSDTHKDQAPQHCDDEALDVWGYYLASGAGSGKKDIRFCEKGKYAQLPFSRPLSR